MMLDKHALLLIATMSLVTIAIRFAPFIVFKKGTPKIIEYLGDVLPYSIMAMLVVYCLKDTSFESFTSFLPELIAVIYTIVIHKLKHNILLSIVTATILCMFLITIF